MYTAEINRKQPAFLLLLVDQSYSMSEPWGVGGKSKAQALAQIVNRVLSTAVVLCTKGDDRILDYFEVGIIGYGTDVIPALPGATEERPVLPISEVGHNPLRVDQVRRKVPDGAGGLAEVSSAMAIWMDPLANGTTPMVKAFDTAEKAAALWCDRHPRSFPPVIINLTDGESSDGDPGPAAARLRAQATDDGNALVFNVHLSALDGNMAQFPSPGHPLPNAAAARLFDMSSELPMTMAEAASAMGYPIKPGARGFLYNADQAAVIEFLDIGTRGVTPSDPPELTDGNN